MLAPGLENAVAGTQLLVVGKDDEVSLLKEEVMQDMESIFDSVDRSGMLSIPLAQEPMPGYPMLCSVHTDALLAMVSSCRLRHVQTPCRSAFLEARMHLCSSACVPGVQVRESVCKRVHWGPWRRCLEFLRSQKEPIPVSSIAIGPIHRKDVMRAKVMLEKVCTAPF